MDDSISEPDEQFTVELSSSDPGVMIIESILSVTIVGQEFSQFIIYNTDAYYTYLTPRSCCNVI